MKAPMIRLMCIYSTCGIPGISMSLINLNTLVVDAYNYSFTMILWLQLQLNYTN